MLTTVREVAPFVTAIMVLGAADGAITVDLGLRKIREELDALQVLGVDPLKNLVVPRLLALKLVTGLLHTFALVVGMTSGRVTVVMQGEALGDSLRPFSATPRC